MLSLGVLPRLISDKSDVCSFLIKENSCKPTKQNPLNLKEKFIKIYLYFSQFSSQDSGQIVTNRKDKSCIGLCRHYLGIPVFLRSCRKQVGGGASSVVPRQRQRPKGVSGLPRVLLLGSLGSERIAQNVASDPRQLFSGKLASELSGSAVTDDDSVEMCAPGTSQNQTCSFWTALYQVVVQCTHVCEFILQRSQKRM